jgi:hypothetical protein
VLGERGELPEQALGSFGFIRPGLLGDVRAQRFDLADRDLVGGTSSLHDHAFGYHAVVIRNVNWRGSLGAWAS